LLVHKLTGAKLVYHEHDASIGRTSLPGQVAGLARRRVLDVADVVVVPSEGRRALLGSRGDRSIVVWNCPLISEISEKAVGEEGRVTMAYAGSLSPDRLPATFIHALAKLPATVDLKVFGYETIGFPNYYAELQNVARELGVAGSLSRRIAPSRRQLLSELETCDIGIATLNLRSTDANVQSMLGASNKPFDYLAAGLPILVSNAPDWINTFVEPGYATSCDPNDVDSIVAGVQPLLDPAVRHRMASAGRARLLSDWNYERQFAPVFDRLVG
ncbi:MAG TPA: glycosyltransferase, partial [Longimicrobiales bacterium]|nr:glycosyltransferase [Longimicrobiales bacterium]